MGSPAVLRGEAARISPPYRVANFDRPPEAAVLAGGFGIVTRFTKCLPVAPVPEQLLVSPMRNDVIDDLCGSDSTFAFARRAQRVLAKEYGPRLAPARVVATACG